MIPWVLAPHLCGGVVMVMCLCVCVFVGVGGWFCVLVEMRKESNPAGASWQPL